MFVSKNRNLWNKLLMVLSGTSVYNSPCTLGHIETAKVTSTMNPLISIRYRRHPPGEGRSHSLPHLSWLISKKKLEVLKASWISFFVNESNRETTAVRSISEPVPKPLVSNGKNRLHSMEGKIDKLENEVQKLLKLAQPRPQHHQGGNYGRDKAPGGGGRDWIKDEECFACREKGHFAKDCMTVQAPQGYNDLNHRGSGVGANPRPSNQDNSREFPDQPNLREIRAQPILMDSRGFGPLRFVN